MNVSEELLKKLKKSVKTLAAVIRRKALQLAEFAAANKKISIPAAAAVIVILLAFLAALGAHKEEGVSLGEIEMERDGVGSVIPVPDVPLEENAYPEINELLQNYYKAMADGDIDTVTSLKSYTSDVEKIRIKKKAEFIENYPKVDCYTKIGPMADSYIVYVYYETKFFGYEEEVPGIHSYFVCRNEAGNYWLIDGEIDENVENYIAAISAQDDVNDLFMRADVEYKDIINSNEELSAFLTDLRNTLKDSVSEELAAQVVAESGETETETEAETETETEALENVTQIVAANDVVNIRSSDSETADKLGKAEVGQQFTLLENRGNGWSKIDYNGKEAFIKTEFLTVVETQETGNNAEDGNDAETVNNGNAQNNQTAENDGPSDPTGKTVIVKESVNVRKSANENGERIATVYRGEVLEVIMKQADGWTKIKYNGQTAYVKSDYVE